MSTKRYHISLRVFLFVPVFFVSWLMLNIQPFNPNNNETVPETGAAWSIQNQREYGWPWKCIVARPVLDFDRPWDASDTRYSIHSIRIYQLAGNLLIAIVSAGVPLFVWRKARQKKLKIGHVEC